MIGFDLVHGFDVIERLRDSNECISSDVTCQNIRLILWKHFLLIIMQTSRVSYLKIRKRMADYSGKLALIPKI